MKILLPFIAFFQISYLTAASDCIGVCTDLKENFVNEQIEARYSYKYLGVREIKNTSHVESRWNNSTIKDLKISDSSIVESSFSSVKVGNIDVNNSTFAENKLSYSSYSSASFKNVNLEESQLNNTAFGKASFVNVDARNIEQMLEMGYEQNHTDKRRLDTFRLKSA